MRGTYKEGEDASFTLGVTINGAGTNATELVATSGTGNDLGDIVDLHHRL